MKKMRVIGCFLAVLLLLAGCNPAPGPNNMTTAVPLPSSTVENLPEIVMQQLPETLNNPDGLPVLKWVCLVDHIYGGGERRWNEAAVIELNEMLTQKGAAFRVQFTMLTSPDMEYSEWFTRPEALEILEDADLIYGLMTGRQMQEYLAPITAYIEGTESTALASLAIHPYSWTNGTVGGEIYGISTRPAQIYCGGWKVDPSVFTEYGLTEADFAKPYWEMQDVFSQIYAKNGNRSFLYAQAGTVSSMPLNGVGPESMALLAVERVLKYQVDLQSSFVALDYSSGTPKVINYLEMETYRNILAAYQEYAAADYITKKSDQALITYTYSKLDQVSTDGNGNRIIPNTEPLINTTSEKHVTGIAADAAHPQEAIELLKLIAADKEFQMQLFYGKEGRDYKVEEGSYAIIAQPDGSNYSLDFLFELSYFSDMSSHNKPAYDSPSTLSFQYWANYEGKTVLQTQQELAENCTIWCPVGFDYTGLEAETLAVQNLAKENFEKTATMSKAEYEQFVQGLKNAGLDRIVTELQRQLDTWLAENPDWNK